MLSGQRRRAASDLAGTIALDDIERNAAAVRALDIIVNGGGNAAMPPLPRLGTQDLINAVFSETNPLRTRIVRSPDWSIYNVIGNAKLTSKQADIIDNPGKYSRTQYINALRRALVKQYNSQHYLPRRPRNLGEATARAWAARESRRLEAALAFANQTLSAKDTDLYNYLGGLTFRAAAARKPRAPRDVDEGFPWYWNYSKIHTTGGKTQEIKDARKASSNKAYKKWLERKMKLAAAEYTRKFPAEALRIAHGFY